MPRFEREIILPVPGDFVWPAFAFVAFYEHSGEEREANASELNMPTCSVADRRTVRAPSESAWHFIGSVRDFVFSYPHPIPRQSNHVNCGHANWGSWQTWPAKILDGTMLAAAEEMLWINCIGDRSLGEQPPTAHQHTVGPPTYVTNGCDFGAPSKTYYMWARNLPATPPTDVVPPAERWSELAVTGSTEARTVMRSYTPRNKARAEARCHAHVTGGDTSEFGRPAAQTCKAYGEWRRQLLFNFSCFAAHYAPTVCGEWLRSAEREPALLMVPLIHTAAGVCFMISLLSDDAIFGAQRDKLRGGAEQGEQLAAFISGGVETQYASPMSHYGHGDSVVIIPWTTKPITIIKSVAQRHQARASGLSAAWCTCAALHDHVAYRPALLAMRRVESLSGPGAHGSQRPGIWAAPRPMVHARTGRRWADQPNKADADLDAARSAFMAAEHERGKELRACLIAVDDGSGEMVSIADSVRTAADYQAEIPFPANGLPSFASNSLRLRLFVERPLSLDTSYLARLPPQQVPPGFVPCKWNGILRGWVRRLCCASLNATGDRDFECWEKGGSEKKRPAYVCIGQGGGVSIPHADGIGTWNALILVYEVDPATGLCHPLDYTRKGRTHWVLDMLRRIFGIHNDKQLMSLLFDGVRWGIKAPLQIRIAANLERMDTRIRGVGAAFKKLLDNRLYYNYKKLRRAHEVISPDGPCPFIIIPSYILGSGGTDKPDNPDEKRIVGDAGKPYPDDGAREQNAPHGEPTGEVQQSINDMMGPPPGTARGEMLDASRYPMPHPEIKARPREVYNDDAVLSHMAYVGDTYLAGGKDDGRHMFFQFEVAPEDERLSNFLVLIELPNEDENGNIELDPVTGAPVLTVWLVLIVATCMNMGSRNASKIAQRFTDRILEGFSEHLDIYVREVWLKKQTKELQLLLQEREEKLGPRQARPYATSGYTDDYKFTYVGPELTAAGTLIWRTMCRRANYWLSAKACAGTVLDYIGGREVLNGGFGCLPSTKHSRALRNTTAAIAGDLSRDEMIAHASFMVHAADWLDFPAGTLKGLSAPTKVPGPPEELMTVTGVTKSQWQNILHLLQTRNAASFWSGVNEACDLASFDGLIFAPRFASDSCSDVPHPHICGVAAGLFFRFPLEGEWRNRHITLTEGCGTELCGMVFPPYFPNYELCTEGDATAALSGVTATAQADDLIYMRARAKENSVSREASTRMWITHCKGWANGLPDSGSRDKMDVMRDLAKAYGIRLREIPIPQEALDFMSDVLANTTSTRASEAAHATTMGTHNLNMIGNMPIAQLDVQPDDAADGGQPPLNAPLVIQPPPLEPADFNGALLDALLDGYLTQGSTDGEEDDESGSSDEVSVDLSDESADGADGGDPSIDAGDVSEHDAPPSDDEAEVAPPSDDEAEIDIRCNACGNTIDMCDCFALGEPWPLPENQLVDCPACGEIWPNCTCGETAAHSEALRPRGGGSRGTLARRCPRDGFQPWAVYTAFRIKQAAARTIQAAHRRQRKHIVRKRAAERIQARFRVYLTQPARRLETLIRRWCILSARTKAAERIQARFRIYLAQPARQLEALIRRMLRERALARALSLVRDSNGKLLLRLRGGGNPGEMQRLLDQLNQALLDSAALPAEASAQLIEIYTVPIANKLQQRAQVTAGTINAIVAACRYLKQSHIYDTIVVAARASGGDRKSASLWAMRISTRIAAEPPGEAPSVLGLVDDDGPRGQAPHPIREAPSPPRPDAADGLSMLADISIGSSGSAPLSGPAQDAGDGDDGESSDYWTCDVTGKRFHRNDVTSRRRHIESLFRQGGNNPPLMSAYAKRDRTPPPSAPPSPPGTDPKIQRRSSTPVEWHLLDTVNDDALTQILFEGADDRHFWTDRTLSALESDLGKEISGRVEGDGATATDAPRLISTHIYPWRPVHLWAADEELVAIIIELLSFECPTISPAARARYAGGLAVVRYMEAHGSKNEAINAVNQELKYWRREQSHAHQPHDKYMSNANRIVTNPTEAQWRSMKEGDTIRLAPKGAKADPYGTCDAAGWSSRTLTLHEQMLGAEYSGRVDGDGASGTDAVQALRLALQAIDQGHGTDSYQFLYAARELGRHIGINNMKTSSVNTMYAVLRHKPPARQAETCRAHGARASSFATYKGLVDPLLAAMSLADLVKVAPPPTSAPSSPPEADRRVWTDRTLSTHENELGKEFSGRVEGDGAAAPMALGDDGPPGSKRLHLDALAVAGEVDWAARERDEHDFMLCITEYVTGISGFAGHVRDDFEAFGPILPSRRPAYLGKVIKLRRLMRLINHTGYARISGIGTMNLIDGRAMALRHLQCRIDKMRWMARAMQWCVAQDEHRASVRDDTYDEFLRNHDFFEWDVEDLHFWTDRTLSAHEKELGKEFSGRVEGDGAAAPTTSRDDGPARWASPEPFVRAPPPNPASSRRLHVQGSDYFDDSPEPVIHRSARAQERANAPLPNPPVVSPGPCAKPAATRASPRHAKPESTTEDIDDVIAAQVGRRPTSPQPETADAARAAAAHDLASRLVSHNSKYALCPDRPEVLRDIVVNATAARDAGIPQGTRSADEWGFRWVKRFCEATGNVIMRPRDVFTDADVLCEIWFTTMALIWVAQMIAPSARRRAAGYGQGLPTSALLAIYAYRRVMRDCGRYIPDMAQTRAVLKGLCMRYKARWGDDAFVPERKQPFSTAHLVSIIAALTSVTALSGWPTTLRLAMLVAFCYALSTGARKDEWTLSFEGDTFVRRSNFAWVDMSSDTRDDLPSTPEVIRSRRNGCLLRGRSAASKCDRLNIEWGAKDMWFRYDDSNSLNFAWRWQQWELAHPCPIQERSNWPAFSPTGDAMPFTGSKAQACLNVLLAAAMSVSDAAKRTWHSCRITLATRLYARRGRGILRDEVEGVIQSLVRWKTPEAMRIYTRTEPEQYADYLDMAYFEATPQGAAREQHDGSTPPGLPETDPEGVVADTDATIEAIDAEATAQATARRREKAKDQGGAADQPKRRRATPATGKPSAGAAEPEAAARTFFVGDGLYATHKGDDTWGVVGQEVKMHHSLWGEADGGYTNCRVVAYAGRFKFSNGTTAPHTYVIESDGHHYVVTHTTVAGALTDDGVKRRVKKAPAPRLLK